MSRKRNLANKLDARMVFGDFHKERNRESKIDFIGKIPTLVKEISSDFKVVGDVRVEKVFDSDLYRVDITPRPVMIDIDLFYIVMKKHSIEGFFVDSGNSSIFIHITYNQENE
jgi:hypothetical protein